MDGLESLRTSRCERLVPDGPTASLRQLSRLVQSTPARMARPLAAKRLTKELTELRKPGGTPEGCVILQADDLTTWTFSIEVLGESSSVRGR